ncbi:sensor histidine kinase [Larkinella bovis]|uniref:Sensor histidine kinase n=1 Tax=Larkinella bovis TaxID=683041 RepID=A0ABW0I6F8_9BACT
MKLFTILLLAVVVSRLAVAQTPEAVVFNGQPTTNQGIDIRRQTLYYEDPARDTLQALASVRTRTFVTESSVPSVQSHGAFLKATRIVWLQFRIVNAHGLDTLRLWYDPGTHALSTLYSESGRLIGKVGLLAREGASHQGLPITIPPRTGQTYFVRLVDYIRVFPMPSDRLFTPEGFARALVQGHVQVRWLAVVMSVMIGCLLLMGLFTVFHYFLNRDKTFLYYALYAGAGFCWIVKFADGRLALGLAPESMPQLLHPTWISISYAVSFCYALFLVHLLNLPREQPIIWRIIRLLMAVLVIQQMMALSEAFTGPWFTNNTYYLFSDLSGLLTGLLLIVATIRSKSPMKPYLLAGEIGLFCIAISPLHGFLWFDSLPAEMGVIINYPPFFMATGLVIELVCFALALAYRNRLAELENKSLQAQYTQKLEQELVKRTSEIRAQQNELEEQRIRQLELKFEQKLAETELTALRAQMNPHFIFNCLNSIKLYATDNEAGKASDYLTKFSRLIRLVLENSRSERVTLQNELGALELYLQMEAMRFKNKLRFQIDVEEQIDAEFVEIPPLLLQPYVENAIWHGLMHKLEGGTVWVRVEQPAEDQLRITIADDGIGRAKAAEFKSKSATAAKSFGMKVTDERIALINQLYRTQTRVQVRDRVDSLGQPAGTEVVVTIPF